MQMDKDPFYSQHDEDEHLRAASALSVKLLRDMAERHEAGEVCFVCTMRDMLPRMFAIYVNGKVNAAKLAGADVDGAALAAYVTLLEELPLMVLAAKELIKSRPKSKVQH